METIFDHNPTDEELLCAVGGTSPHILDAVRAQRSQDGHYADIVALMRKRGDMKRAGHYLSLIRDEEYRRDILQLISKVA